MAIKIDTKIVGYSVKNEKSDEKALTNQEPIQDALPLGIEMNESVERPERLVGSTYKVKTPLSQHAMYITVNDMILNEGTDHEERRPFEMFINSKSMDHFQWIVALTRIISAVFRKGGDISFLAEELGSVFDPKGGYFKSGGKYMPSLVAEIGDVLQKHLEHIGMIDKPVIDATRLSIINAKKAELSDSKKADEKESANEESEGTSSFPDGATLCKNCMTKAAIFMDGCLTCLNCGESNCG